jgi:hypothetical protein
MKKSISILILFLLLMFPSCRKTQNKQDASINSEEIIDSTVVKLSQDTFSIAEINKLEENYKKPRKELLGGIVIIKNTRDLVNIVEPILFSIYGKKNIVGERPYYAKLIGDYWEMSGSLPTASLGGTFFIVINRKTCEIVRLFHGK